MPSAASVAFTRDKTFVSLLLWIIYKDSLKIDFTDGIVEFGR